MAVVTEEQFNKLLDEFRSNQLQFLTTQRPEYQKAAKISQSAIEDALMAKQETVNKQRRDMKHFANSYEEGTKELFTLVENAGDMRGNAQKMMDRYETSKTRYETWSEKSTPGSIVDYAVGYGILWRVGIIMILFPVLILLGFYSPQLYQTAFSSPLTNPMLSSASPRPGWLW
jgi:hypothetical protein